MNITKTYSNRHLAGEYKPTAIDKAKENSNRLINISEKFYTVITAAGEIINFDGKRKFNTWTKTNNYTTDF